MARHTGPIAIGFLDKEEVPMALEKTGLMRRRGEHAFAA
jgi:hypothetical protein